MAKKDNKQELAINVKKEENISEWYTQVIQKADLIEYTDVSGCMIFKPNSYEIWEKIQSFLDFKIKKMGVRNAYFPLFIPKKLLCKEEDHVEGFAPEVAWVDYGGDTKLGERLAIRPTSETIMYDAYSKWINSYRDLPLKMNQWCNVVRWEFKHATPFLRNREFLWQEGHTVFETKEEADKDVMDALNAYGETYEDLLAIPVTLGRKSVGEKFAGADYSYTAEPFSYVDGKSIQACTSHHLGQNFGKAFNIEFLDKNQKKQIPYQNSWGFSTRSIGAMIMIHSDDNGLVLPPRVAKVKIVIVPLLFKGKEEAVLNKALEMGKKLESLGVIVDDRNHVSAGFKFNEWEMKGIPIRIEVGPRDLDNNVFQYVRRDLGVKVEEKLDLSNVKKVMSEVLENMHEDMFNKAKSEMAKVTVETENYEDFKKAILDKKRCLVPWAENVESEDKIKEETGAKTSCIPFEFEKKSLKGKKCFYSGKDATCWVYFCKTH
ncbi:MAG: proline--tRNA ligase [Nanoarchaeota archaeon]|nr:proline--tRNA ligase [Nanoarchaeota archaeon]